MKAVFALTLLVCIGLLAYWFGAAPKSGGPVLTIPIGWGKPDGGQIEMNAIVGVGLAHKSRKNERLGSQQARNWDEWVNTHCIIKSASGETVKIRRQGNSTVIPYREVQATVGTEEFFLAAGLAPGTSYVFDYIIENPDREVYQCRFTAPTDVQKTIMYDFELLKE